MHPFVQAWNRFEATEAPYVLADDADALSSCKDTVTYHDLPSYLASEHLDAVDDRCLHLGLLPQPFCGRIRNACVYVLLLNPGLAPVDYFELEHPAFKAAVLDSFRDPMRPFLFLDERHCWHGGYAWWTRKLSDVIGELARSLNIGRRAARTLVAENVASIELVPYHSTAFRPRGLRPAELPSARLARAFVHEVVLPRAQRGECGVVVTRAAKEWGLSPGDNVVVYDAGRARSASLGKDTDGGMLALRHLTRSATVP